MISDLAPIPFAVAASLCANDRSASHSIPAHGNEEWSSISSRRDKHVRRSEYAPVPILSPVRYSGFMRFAESSSELSQVLDPLYGLKTMLRESMHRCSRRSRLLEQSRRCEAISRLCRGRNGGIRREAISARTHLTLENNFDHAESNARKRSPCCFA